MRERIRLWGWVLAVSAATASVQAVEPAAAPKARPAQTEGLRVQQALDRGAAFLAKVQAADGSFSPAGPGVTAVVATGLLRAGRGPNDPTVAKALAHLESMVRPDGGIYSAGSLYQNYETCLALMAFAEANRDGRYATLLKRAETYLKQQQWDESEGLERSNTSYGGAGYGKNKRPDLSNTQFFIEALKSVGDGPDDEAIRKALVFVSRCQNLESEYNTTEHAAKNPDGGFYYTVAAGGQSMAGDTPEGGLRSYGSMTYAGLKSMIYAGVGPEDPRVKAALAWAQKHYDLKANPGMGDAGLYYYYHTFAKALDAMKLTVLEDAQGQKHDWRRNWRPSSCVGSGRMGRGPTRTRDGWKETRG